MLDSRAHPQAKPLRHTKIRTRPSQATAPSPYRSSTSPGHRTLRQKQRATRLHPCATNKSSCFLNQSFCVGNKLSCFLNALSCIRNLHACFLNLFSCRLHLHACFLNLFSCRLNLHARIRNLHSSIPSLNACAPLPYCPARRGGRFSADVSGLLGCAFGSILNFHRVSTG
jgi:hypothetical protein